MTDRSSEFQYLASIIDEVGFGSDFLDEIIALAREGIETHGGAIRRVCDGAAPSGNASERAEPAVEFAELINATHRLTNVVIALRLESLARSINRCEAHARNHELPQFCEVWSTLEDTVEKIYGEICDYSSRRSGI